MTKIFAESPDLVADFRHLIPESAVPARLPADPNHAQEDSEVLMSDNLAQFGEILQSYQRDSLPIKDVYARVVQLIMTPAGAQFQREDNDTAG
ncbi:hypothetical protein MMC15_003282 [Xylographa vitiligo]|nr:hypothetical protein [Xylographa vitiligo]